MSINTHNLVIQRGKKVSESFQLSVPDLNIHTNEFWWLKGESGSGKSSLLLTVAGLLVPSSGVLTVCGNTLTALNETERDAFRGQNVGMVFQDHQLFDELNALENLLVAVRFGQQRSTDATDLELARHLLNEVGLGNKEAAKPRELSLGQQQRIAVARAMMNRPKLLLVDEPTASLDQKNTEAVTELIQTFAEQEEMTVLFSTHNLNLIPQGSKQVICL